MYIFQITVKVELDDFFKTVLTCNKKTNAGDDVTAICSGWNHINEYNYKSII